MDGRVKPGHDELRIVGLLSTMLLLASPALADESATDLETIVVTATRTPQPLDKTGTSMSVITADDLKTQQTVIVTDILAETPGLTVNRNGGAGQTTSVSIRGAETGQTLVLIDGVRINDPSSVDDQAILGDLLTNNIDRIEVLRGPQSTLYGSDAIGGVVNVAAMRRLRSTPAPRADRSRPGMSTQPRMEPWAMSSTVAR
jgi:vitamin B12 transporter